jgi:hypothetical protein
MDGYHYGCLQFVHQLVQCWGARRSTEYFRKNQPWNSMERLLDETAITNATAVTAWTWRLPGVRDVDVARFYRDSFPEELRRELDWLQARWEKEDPSNAPVMTPYLAAARALLLNETPQELAKVAPLDQFHDVPYHYLALLRAGTPHRFERLIPAGGPSPFVAGLEREVRATTATLVTAVEVGGEGWSSSPGTNSWPRLVWLPWTSPDGTPLSFGRIEPVRAGLPRSIKRNTLNWNTEVVTYGLP